MDSLELDDIQGLVRTAFQDYGAAAYQLLAIDNPQTTKKWLAGLRKENWIKSAEDTRGFKTRGDDSDHAAAIAFTASGLRTLGLQDETLKMFVSEFQEGMTAEHRSRLLGDIGKSDPGDWLWGRRGQQVDILLIVFAKAARLWYCIDHIGEIPRKPPLVHQFLGAWMSREPFGFADGLSQPLVEGLSRQAASAGERAVKAGEFVLGYVNEFGQRPASPWVPVKTDPSELLARVPASDCADFGRNGTFLVLRQLEQAVGQFESFLDETAASLLRERGAPERDSEQLAEWIGAKLVGRWRSGAPLVRHAENPFGNFPDSDNDFSFHREDRHGFRCPIGAHIRRANPRDSLADGSGVFPAEAQKMVNQHRILRRGRVYADNGSLGLVFLCLNANIERQFEFVQNSWLMHPEFGGLHDETDPLLGNAQAQRTRAMTIQQPLLGRRIDGLGQFVTVKGGGYFFLPGLKALDYLAQLP